jgi:hypothetical protein
MEVDGKVQKVGGYATSDLWERHPTKENLWRMYVLLPPSFLLIRPLMVAF